ncbi:MAG: VWA domain-containing protein [Sebaldella sp.]|nr:VWA domain-containing protein [Sebaldella sp.]
MKKDMRLILLVLLVLTLSACSSVVKDEAVNTVENRTIQLETTKDIEKTAAALDGTIQQIESRSEVIIVGNNFVGGGNVYGYQLAGKSSVSELGDSYSKSYTSNAGSITVNGSTPMGVVAIMNENHNESYSEIKETGFIDAKSSPLSTFSIDVDTASYSNVRRMLMGQNVLPSKDAVRIEEMVNYFTYDYKKPEKKDGKFGVNFEMGDSPWNKNNKILRIAIQGESLLESKKPKSNYVFLIDVSGSMSDANKLPLLKESFKKLVNNLNPDDRVSIVVYASSTGVVLEPTFGKDKTKIIDALDKLNAGGSTAGGDGIKRAYELAKENLIKGGNNRVILATDGDFNVGVTSNAELEDLITSYKNQNIYLTILGFGMGNYKDDKIKRLSDKGNGNYFYIDNIKEADKVFNQGLQGALYTIAKDVKIQIEFNPTSVKEYRLIGYEDRRLNNEDFKDDKKDAGDVGSGHQVTVFYELVPNNGDFSEKKVEDLKYQKTSVEESTDVATFKLRYKEPDGDTSKEIVKVVSPDIYKTKNTIDYNFGLSVVEFGMLLRDSEYKGTLTYSNVLNQAKNNIGKDNYGYKAEFIKLVEKAKVLNEGKK